MRDVTLYHGSRGGIDGKIQPISRLRCDFGKGFYMGEKPEQALGLIANDPSPVLYTINFKLSEIPENRILTLKDLDWLYTILACRKISEEFNQTQFAKMIIQYRNKGQYFDQLLDNLKEKEDKEYDD